VRRISKSLWKLWGVGAIVAAPALALAQEQSDRTGDVLFMIGGGVLALIMLGFLVSRRKRHYPVESPFTPDRRDGQSSPSDEEEIESLL